MGRFALILLVIGGVVGWFWYQELSVSSGTSNTPEIITFEQLLERRTTGNPYVRVSGLVLGSQFVYSQDSRSKAWTAAFIPAFSVNEAKGLVQKGMLQAGADAQIPIKVIVKSTKARSGTDVDQLATQPSHDGLVINRIESLGSEETRMLRNSYPNLDLLNCVIFQVGRTPSSSSTLFLMGGGALVLLVLGVLVGIAALRKSPGA